MTNDFITSFNKALSNEGFLSNNVNDRGGFTYKGISRTKHPAWSGWKIIDDFFRSTDFNLPTEGRSVQLLNNNVALQNEVLKFYRTEFWNKIKGDLLPTQLITDELIESSANLGISAASENIQRVINLLNRNGILYHDIAVDRVIGNLTLEALKKCIAANGEKLIYNLLNFYQVKHYIQIMENDPTQEIFIGWFSRIAIIK